MTEKSDQLKLIGIIQSHLEVMYVVDGEWKYEKVIEYFEKLKHDLQIRRAGDVNELKKDLGIYHNE